MPNLAGLLLSTLVDECEGFEEISISSILMMAKTSNMRLVSFQRKFSGMFWPTCSFNNRFFVTAPMEKISMTSTVEAP